MSSIKKAIFPLHIRPATVADVPTMARQQVTMAEQTEGRGLSPETLYKGLTLGMNTKLSHLELFVAETKRTSTTSVEENEKLEQQQQTTSATPFSPEPIAMTSLRPEFSLLRNSKVFWFEDVFTEEKFRGKGIFRQLYNMACEKSGREGSSSLRLCCDGENTSAIIAYEKVGMYLEKGRPFRWCTPGGDAPLLGEPSEEEAARVAKIPLSTRKNEEADAFAAETIQRCDASVADNEEVVSELADMIWENSQKYHRFANDQENNFTTKFQKENLKEGIKRAIRSSTSFVSKPTNSSNSSLSSESLLSEFYLIKESSSSSKILGCFMLNFEYCNWRVGFSIWLQSFSINIKKQEERRAFIFRSVIRWLQKKVEENVDIDEMRKIPFSGVRFELDLEMEDERNEQKKEDSSLVTVAQEEAFELEHYILMRSELH